MRNGSIVKRLKLLRLGMENSESGSCCIQRDGKLMCCSVVRYVDDVGDVVFSFSTDLLQTHFSTLILLQRFSSICLSFEEYLLSIHFSTCLSFREYLLSEHFSTLISLQRFSSICFSFEEHLLQTSFSILFSLQHFSLQHFSFEEHFSSTLFSFEEHFSLHIFNSSYTTYTISSTLYTSPPLSQLAMNPLTYERLLLKLACCFNVINSHRYT